MADIYLDADLNPLYATSLRAAGNAVVATVELGRRRAHDNEQLAYAAQHGMIIVTHNADDYLLRQRAWRQWADLWHVEPRPLHAGILVIPQVTEDRVDFMAREIDAFIRSGAPLQNRYYKWQHERDWEQNG